MVELTERGEEFVRYCLTMYPLLGWQGVKDARTMNPLRAVMFDTTQTLGGYIISQGPSHENYHEVALSVMRAAVMHSPNSPPISEYRLRMLINKL